MFFPASGQQLEIGKFASTTPKVFLPIYRDFETHSEFDGFFPQNYRHMKRTGSENRTSEQQKRFANFTTIKRIQLKGPKLYSYNFHVFLNLFFSCDLFYIISNATWPGTVPK